MTSTKTNPGNFFEDFRLGQVIRHATPRTVTAATWRSTRLYGAALCGAVVGCLRQGVGYPRAPLDDLLVFHIVFGKTVPDISLNAVANLGYADVPFPHAGLSRRHAVAVSEVIGLKENSNRQTGIVYVRSTGRNQDGETVLEYVPLGDGAQARRSAAGARAITCRDLPTRSTPRSSAPPCPRARLQRATTSRWPAAAPLGRLRGRREDRPRRRHDASRRPSTRSPRGSTRTPPRCISTSTPRPRAASAGARLWRPRHLAGPRAVLQRSGQRLPRRRRSTAAATSPAASPATRCTPGPRCWRRPSCGRTTSARCVCGSVATKNRPCADFPLKTGDG